MEETKVLVFSTCLPLKEAITPQACMTLVFDWISSRPNILNPLVYDPASFHKYKIKKNQHFVLLRNFEVDQKKISACRIVKRRKHGKWYTDCVYFQENGKPYFLLQVYIDSKFPLEKWLCFHKPTIVNMLIEKGYCREDYGIPISDTPLYMDKQYYNECVKYLKEDAGQDLPAVLVSCDKFGNPPVHYIYLAKQLGGMAYVFVQKDPETAKILKADVQGRNVQGDRVGVYFPGESKYKTFEFANCSDTQSLSQEIIEYIRTALAGKQENHPYRWELVADMQNALENSSCEEPSAYSCV